jgi:hypothetical protein
LSTSEIGGEDMSERITDFKPVLMPDKFNDSGGSSTSDKLHQAAKDVAAGIEVGRGVKASVEEAEGVFKVTYQDRDGNKREFSVNNM